MSRVKSKNICEGDGPFETLEHLSLRPAKDKENPVDTGIVCARISASYLDTLAQRFADSAGLEHRAAALAHWRQRGAVFKNLRCLSLRTSWFLIMVDVERLPVIENSRIIIKLDRLIVLSESSLLGWFLYVSLIVIIKGRYPMKVSLIVIIKQVSA